MEKIRLMIIGSNEDGAIDYLYFKYLREAGVDVKLCTSQKLLHRYYRKNLWTKILVRSGIGSIHRKVNYKIVQKTASYQPNVIWVFKGMELSPATLKQLKDQGIFLINYNADNPFVFSGRGSGNSNITKSIGLYDLHFTYDREIKKRLENETGSPVHILPFAQDFMETQRETLTGEVKKICFIGTPDTRRAAFINDLARNNLPVDVYGHNWRKFIREKAIGIHPPVRPRDLPVMLNKYRVQLNLLRVHNSGSHNMRTFEIPGAGAIQLAPKTVDHTNFFEENQSIFLYDSLEDCISKARMLLSADDTVAHRIRKQSEATCDRLGYDYRNRSLESLQIIKKACRRS